MGNQTQRYVRDQLKKRYGLLPSEARKVAGKMLETRIDRPNTVARRPAAAGRKNSRAFFAA